MEITGQEKDSDKERGHQRQKRLKGAERGRKEQKGTKKVGHGKKGEKRKYLRLKIRIEKRFS